MPKMFIVQAAVYIETNTFSKICVCVFAICESQKKCGLQDGWLSVTALHHIVALYKE